MGFAGSTGNSWWLAAHCFHLLNAPLYFLVAAGAFPCIAIEGNVDASL